MDSRLLVQGWFDQFNIGDESYKVSFPKLFPEYELAFNGNDDSIGTILGGGNILSPNYVAAALATKSPKKYTFSVAASDQTPLDKLCHFNKVIVRDKASFERVRKHCQAILGADAAFALEPVPERGREWLEQRFKTEKHDLYQKRVAVCLNGHLGKASDAMLLRDYMTLQTAAQDLANVADNTNASFIFIPMSTNQCYDDRYINSLVANRCKWWRKNFSIYERLTVQQTLDIISSCDAMISTRLHSTIFCLLGTVPFIDLTHHSKNGEFLESCGLSDFSINYWDFTRAQIQSLLQKFLDGQSDHIQELLKVTCDHQRHLLQESLQHVRFG